MSEEEAAREESCTQLANALESRVSTPATLQMMLERTPPRDFQSRATGNAGTAGAPSQGEAVPSVQPLALAGGSLAAVGSGRRHGCDRRVHHQSRDPVRPQDGCVRPR